MNNKIRKLQWGDYFLWNNLSREDKVKRNKQIAKLYLDKGPSILNYYNALKAYFGGFNPKNPYLLTGEPTILPGMGSSVANVVAKEYLLNSGLKAIKSTDYLIKGIQGTFPKANLSNILNKYNNEILNNGILSEFKNTGRFKNIMNEILLEIEKVYGKLGSDAFNIIKTNPEGLPYRLGLEWILKYNFKKGGSLKSANARKWKHQFGGLLGKTLEEVDAINNENRNRAKGLFKGMVSGNILPTALNIGNMLNSAYNGWVEPETTYITGQAPTGGGPKNAGKIVSSVSKAKNTGLPLTKKVDTSIKNTTTYLTGDNRYVLSGQNKITRGQRERALYMITNHYANTQWNKDLLKHFKSREKAKARGANYKKFNLLINDVLDDFIWNSGFFKEGGKFQLGGMIPDFTVPNVNTVINNSPIALQHFQYQLDFMDYLYNKKKLQDELKLLEQLLKLERTNSLLDRFSGIANTAISYLPNILNKNGVPSSFNTSSNLA